MDQGDHYLAQIQCPKSFCDGFPVCLMHHRDPSKNKNDDVINNNSNRNIGEIDSTRKVANEVNDEKHENCPTPEPSGDQSSEMFEESQTQEIQNITPNETEKLNDVDGKEKDEVQENRYSKRTRQKTLKLIESQAQSPPKKNSSQAQSPPKKNSRSKSNACCDVLRIKMQQAEQKANTNEKHLETLRSSLVNKEAIVQAQSKILEDNKRTIENLNVY